MIETVILTDWEPVGDEEDASASLHTTISIAGVLMHVDATAVEVVHGIQTPVEGAIYTDSDFSAIHAAVGADGAWQTALIDGREYVLVATPHC